MMQSAPIERQRTATRVAGLLLWRTGLLLAAFGGIYTWAVWLLSLLVLPTPILIALGLIVTGFIFVIASLIAESRQQNREMLLDD